MLPHILPQRETGEVSWIWKYYWLLASVKPLLQIRPVPTTHCGLELGCWQSGRCGKRRASVSFGRHLTLAPPITQVPSGAQYPGKSKLLLPRLSQRDTGDVAQHSVLLPFKRFPLHLSCSLTIQNNRTAHLSYPMERIWRKILGKDLGGTSMLATKVDWPNARAMIRETIQNNRTAPLLPHEEDLEEDFGEEKYFSAGRKC